MSRKIQKIKYGEILLPSVWQNIPYFSAIYFKNISEIQGYFDVGWSELKTLAPDMDLKWPNKLTYFKLKIHHDGEKIYGTIVGFDEINKTNNKLLRKKYARHTIEITIANTRLQLQLIYARIGKLSSQMITKFRNDMVTLINTCLPDTVDEFFNSYMDGLEQKLHKQIKELNPAYNEVGMVRIVKCKTR